MAIDTLTASSASSATSGLGEQGLGEPFPDVVLPAARHRSEPVQRLAGDDPDQIRPGVTHFGLIDIGPTQPGLLHDVLGVGRGTEHLVGDREEQATVRDERVVDHALEATASGLRSQAAENSCDSMPMATLERAMRLASAMTVVSSTRAAGPGPSAAGPTVRR